MANYSNSSIIFQSRGLFVCQGSEATMLRLRSLVGSKLDSPTPGTITSVPSAFVRNAAKDLEMCKIYREDDGILEIPQNEENLEMFVLNIMLLPRDRSELLSNFVCMQRKLTLHLCP